MRGLNMPTGKTRRHWEKVRALGGKLQSARGGRRGGRRSVWRARRDEKHARQRHASYARKVYTRGKNQRKTTEKRFVFHQFERQSILKLIFQSKLPPKDLLGSLNNLESIVNATRYEQQNTMRNLVVMVGRLGGKTQLGKTSNMMRWWNDFNKNLF